MRESDCCAVATSLSAVRRVSSSVRVALSTAWRARFTSSGDAPAATCSYRAWADCTAACACASAISRSVVSSFASAWPAATRCPTVTETCASFPGTLNARRTSPAVVIAPGALIVILSAARVTGAVRISGSAAPPRVITNPPTTSAAIARPISGRARLLDMDRHRRALADGETAVVRRETDADRDDLRDLGERAVRVERREHRERGLRRVGERLDHAAERRAGNGVDGHVDRLADVQAMDVALVHVRDDPHVRGVRDDRERPARAGEDLLADDGIRLHDDAVDRRLDLDERELHAARPLDAHRPERRARVHGLADDGVPRAQRP